MTPRQKRQPSNRLLAVTAVAALVLASAAVLLSLQRAAQATQPAATTAPTAAATTPARATTTAAATLPTPTPTLAPTTTARPRDRAAVIPDSPPLAEIAPGGKIDYSRLDYASLVPAGAAAPDQYFDDAVFIGNSIQQIQRQIGSIRADYITTGDFNVFRYFEWDLSMPDGAKMTVAAYLQSHRYGKIYLTFGINEVSYDDQAAVWQGYRAMLRDVRQKQPEAVIYLVGLLPVYPPLMNETARALITPEKILEFNHKLAILAEDEGVWMLNPAAALQDENGLLNPAWSRDGVHFGKAATDLWDTYTRTHTVAP